LTAIENVPPDRQPAQATVRRQHEP
jgi:hypothetical protein